MKQQSGRPSYSREDWQHELALRGRMDCKFRCPFCGNEASPADWVAAAADVADLTPEQRSHVAQRAPRECIGRLVGAKGGLHKGKDRPCDWAAFGLFSTLNEGTQVDLGPGLSTIWVFDFAEEAV